MRANLVSRLSLLPVETCELLQEVFLISRIIKFEVIHTYRDLYNSGLYCYIIHCLVFFNFFLFIYLFIYFCMRNLQIGQQIAN